jgi:hypothetical protein
VETIGCGKGGIGVFHLLLQRERGFTGGKGNFLGNPARAGRMGYQHPGIDFGNDGCQRRRQVVYFLSRRRLGCVIRNRHQ